MLYALNNGEKIRATKEAVGNCPDCQVPLITKCGEVLLHHWAHPPHSESCNYKPETEWHRAWKTEFPKDWVEVKVGDHRADVITPKRWVIEFQNSAISVGEIKAREAEYETMVWVFNAMEWRRRLAITYNTNSVFRFSWQQPHQTILTCTSKVFLHIDDDNLFEIKVSNKRPCVGTGRMFSRQHFIQFFRAHTAPIGGLFVGGRPGNNARTMAIPTVIDKNGEVRNAYYDIKEEK